MQAVTGRASAWLDAFLDAYFKTRRIEAGGRIYRALGIESLYEKLALAAGERPLGPLDRMTPLEELEFSKADLERTLTGSNYFDFANMVRVVAYLPPLSMAFRSSLWVGFVWGILLILLHLSMVCVERYKRILCATYLTILPEGFVAQPKALIVPKAMKEASLAARFFGQWWWETETIYVRLGFERFRKFVHFYANRTRIDPKERITGSKFQFVEGVGRQNLDNFLQTTRVSETTHLVGLGLNVPLLIPFAVVGHTFGVVYVGAIIVFDAYCAGLQRYHRVRASRLRRDRKKKS